MYEKELDFLISTSYGPGRYDDVYEVEGQDYPIGYVRWTENRNMEEYLRLLAEGRVSLEGLGQETFSVDEAETAYEALKSGESKPLLVLLSYPEREDAATRTTRLRTLAPKPGEARRRARRRRRVRAGAAPAEPASSCATHYELRAVMSRTGATAKAVAARAEAAYATTDLDEVLRDDAIDLVLISTRHDSHAALDAASARGRQERLRREAARARRGGARRDRGVLRRPRGRRRC